MYECTIMHTLKLKTFGQNFVRKFICPKCGVIRKFFRPKVLNSSKIEKHKEM